MLNSFELCKSSNTPVFSNCVSFVPAANTVACGCMAETKTVRTAINATAITDKILLCNVFIFHLDF